MRDRRRSPRRGRRGGRRWPQARHPEPISRKGRKPACLERADLPGSRKEITSRRARCAHREALFSRLRTVTCQKGH
eukprot:6211829-Pleurochrysis_carterae.AAC.3